MPRDRRKDIESRKQERSANYPNLRPRPDREARTTVKRRQSVETANRAPEQEGSNLEASVPKTTTTMGKVEDSASDPIGELSIFIETPLSSDTATESGGQDSTPKDQKVEVQEEKGSLIIVKLPEADCQMPGTAEPATECTITITESTSTATVNIEDATKDIETPSIIISVPPPRVNSDEYDELNALAVAVASAESASSSDNKEAGATTQPKADEATN